jgi:hemoglobin
MHVQEDPEAAIAACVETFYARALADDALGPMFREAIDDLPAHLQVIRDFWSNALLGTKRYAGSAYAAHAKLPIEWPHFDRWLALFEAAARETLPAELAERALARARHMTQSFRVGLFPFHGPDGQPSRTPA